MMLPSSRIVTWNASASVPTCPVPLTDRSSSRPVPTVTVTEQIVAVVVMPVTLAVAESVPILPPGILLLFVELTESPEEIVPGNATRDRDIEDSLVRRRKRRY